MISILLAFELMIKLMINKEQILENWFEITVSV